MPLPSRPSTRGSGISEDFQAHRPDRWIDSAVERPTGTDSRLSGTPEAKDGEPVDSHAAPDRRRSSKRGRHRRKRAAVAAAAGISEASEQDSIDWRAECMHWRESHRDLQRRMEDSLQAAEKRRVAQESEWQYQVLSWQHQYAAVEAQLSRWRARAEAEARRSGGGKGTSAEEDEGEEEAEGLREQVRALERELEMARQEGERKAKSLEARHATQIATMREQNESDRRRLVDQREASEEALRKAVRREADSARQLSILESKAKSLEARLKVTTEENRSLREAAVVSKRAVTAAERSRSAASQRWHANPLVESASMGPEMRPSSAHADSSANQWRLLSTAEDVRFLARSQQEETHPRDIPTRPSTAGAIESPKRLMPSPIGGASGSLPPTTPIASLPAVAQREARKEAATVEHLRAQLREEERLRSALEKEVNHWRTELRDTQKKLQQAQSNDKEPEATETAVSSPASGAENAVATSGEPNHVVRLESEVRQLKADLENAQDEAAATRASLRSAQANAQLWKLRLENAQRHHGVKSSAASVAATEGSGAGEDGVSERTTVPASSRAKRDMTTQTEKRDLVPSKEAEEEESRIVRDLRHRLVRAEKDYRRIQEERDRAVSRQAEALATARVSMTDAVTQKESEIAALHEENRVLVRQLVDAQTRLVDMETDVAAGETAGEEGESSMTDDVGAAAGDDVDEGGKPIPKWKKRIQVLQRKIEEKEHEVTLRSKQAVGLSRFNAILEAWERRVMQKRMRQWWAAAHVVESRVQQQVREEEFQDRLNAHQASAEEQATAAKEAMQQAMQQQRQARQALDQAQQQEADAEERVRAMEQERDSARLTIGQERRKLADARDRIFRLQVDVQRRERAAAIANIRHVLSLCIYASTLRRTLRERDEDARSKLLSTEAAAERLQSRLIARLEAATQQTAFLHRKIRALPQQLEQASDATRLRELENRQESIARKLVRAKHKREDAVSNLLAKRHTEGVRVGSMRAYEHKLREHMSVSAVKEDGQVDARHLRTASRLEADIEVAGEKVNRAREDAERAERQAEEAEQAFQGIVQEALVAKDDIIGELSSQWENIRSWVYSASKDATDMEMVQLNASDRQSVRGTGNPSSSGTGHGGASALWNANPRDPGSGGAMRLAPRIEEAAQSVHAVDATLQDALSHTTEAHRANKWGAASWEPWKSEAFRQMEARRLEREGVAEEPEETAAGEGEGVQ